MWKNLDPASKRAVKFSILGCAPIIFLSFFKWYIIKYFTGLIEAPLEIFAFFLLIVTLFMPFSEIISKFKKYGKQAIYPFLIPLFVFLIVVNNVPTEIAMRINFENHYQERAEVVKLIKSGKIKDNRTNFRLPAKYKELSDRGTIFFTKEGNKTGILFDYYSTLGGFVSFLYIDKTNWSLSNPYKDKDFAVELDYGSKIKVRDNWYIVSSTD